MYLLLFFVLFGNLILLGRLTLYLLEFLVESVFIPLINWGYKLNNNPVNLELNRVNTLRYTVEEKENTQTTEENNSASKKDLVENYSEKDLVENYSEKDLVENYSEKEKSYIDDKLD